MAILRKNPKCPYCGEIIAEAVYNKNEPHESPIYGDSFSHWEYKKHECEKMLEGQKKIQEIWEKIKTENID
jgi:hypothetical protein